MKMNKKAIQLSVNFIVMVIIAIIVFGFGLKIASDMMSKGSQVTEMKFKEIDTQIQHLACATAERVCLPSQTKTLGDNPVFFGLVIENVFGEEADFDVNVVEVQGNPNLEFNPNGERPVTLQAKEKYKMGIVVGRGEDDVPKGTYTYKATVRKVGASEDYSSPKLFYVKVN